MQNSSRMIPTLLCVLAVSLLYTPAQILGSRLTISGNRFMLNGEWIFLSGGNLAWIVYAKDYGNNQWAGVRSRVENQMKLLHEAGGNTMRVWVHIQGETTPQFNSTGYVIGTDQQGTLISDIKDMLDLAQKYDLLIVPTLWNAAVDEDKEYRLDGLIVDPKKLMSYILVVLIPLVEAVKGHPALGAWDIINEPEGMIIPGQSNTDPCYDTTRLMETGAGWAGKKYKYQQFLRFINWQAAAIKQVDPEVLVSVGVWNPKSNTDSFGMFDHYKDSCLIKAGNRPKGTLDFFQFHSYSWKGKFDEVSPFLHAYKDYGVTKPIVIGEFYEKAAAKRTSSQLFAYCYLYGYSGAWSWDLKEFGEQQRVGVSFIRDFTGNGKIAIKIK